MIEDTLLYIDYSRKLFRCELCGCNVFRELDNYYSSIGGYEERSAYKCNSCETIYESVKYSDTGETSIRRW